MAAGQLCALLLCCLAGDVMTLDSLPARKTWWAKYITPDLYVAGRLTESQVKYAAEDGFKSLIAMYAFDTAETVGEEVVPDDIRLRDVAGRLGGMHYASVLQPGEEYAKLETISRFTAILSEAPPPYLVTSYVGASSTFTALAYLANQTTTNATFRPRVDSAEFYGRAASLGYFYDTPVQTQLVSQLTKQPVVNNPPKPEFTLEDWAFNFWLAKPLYKNVYVAGQIRSNFLDAIGEARFKVIIGLRRGVTTPPDATPSQEEVTLLNIRDRTGTYDGSGRQSTERLLQTRINPDKPNEYVDINSTVNYASRNYLEYGDSLGFNETLMSIDIKKKLPDLTYIHTPIGGQYGYSGEMWSAYKDKWAEAIADDKPVLFVCRTGYRSTVAGILAIAAKERRNSTWALGVAKEIGYRFEEGRQTAVVKLLQDILDNPEPSQPSRGTRAALLDVSLIVSLFTYFIIMRH